MTKRNRKSRKNRHLKWCPGLQMSEVTKGTHARVNADRPHNSDRVITRKRTKQVHRGTIGMRSMKFSCASTTRRKEQITQVLEILSIDFQIESTLKPMMFQHTEKAVRNHKTVSNGLTDVLTNAATQSLLSKDLINAVLA